MPLKKKRASAVTNKKRAVTWEAENATLAFRVRKSYELFRAGDLVKLGQLVDKYPVPSNQLASTLAFLTEINSSLGYALNSEKLVKLKGILSEAKKTVRKKSGVKKVTSRLSNLPIKEREKRLGMAVLPHLDARYAKLFVSLFAEKVGADAWWAFWQQAITNVQVVANKALHEPYKEKSDASEQQKAKKVFFQTKPSVLEALSLLSKNTDAPGYTAIISTLGKSIIAALEESKIVREAVSSSVANDLEDKNGPTTVTGFLDRLYDDGVFLQIHYNIITLKGECEVVFGKDSLVVGFEPSTYLNEKPFLALSPHIQQEVQSIVETFYAYGRILEVVERGSEAYIGLKSVLKQGVADFSLKYGYKLLKTHS